MRPRLLSSPFFLPFCNGRRAFCTTLEGNCVRFWVQCLIGAMLVRGLLAYRFVLDGSLLPYLCVSFAVEYCCVRNVCTHYPACGTVTSARACCVSMRGCVCARGHACGRPGIPEKTALPYRIHWALPHPNALRTHTLVSWHERNGAQWSAMERNGMQNETCKHGKRRMKKDAKGCDAMQ